MSEHNFIKTYLQDLSKLIKADDSLIDQMILVRDALIHANENGKKILVFGNGGSAAIASHVSVDMTKNAKITCLNFNEADLITCFSNDYGFEHWVEKTIDAYGNQGDILILISSSGNSKNMINAVSAGRNGKFHSIITLTGFDKDNPLHQLGDINLWADSKAYNFVENTHQIWLLTIVDLIIGKREYLA
jgi:D-sedoheptulose 7-phosphate isomerase